MSGIGKRAGQGKRLAVGISVAGFVTSLFLVWLVFNVTETEANRRWKADAAAHVALLKHDIDHSIGWLRATYGLFSASNNVTRKEFHDFEASLNIDDRVQAIEWVPKVPQSHRDAFIQTAAAQIGSGFSFKELDADGRFIERREAPNYFPVTYVYPKQTNRKAMGFDLGSNPARFKAISKAIDSGIVTASSRIQLVQETQEQFGFLLFMPFYKSQVRTAPGMPGPKIFEGFILGVFRIGALVASLQKENPAGLRVELFDLHALPAEQRLFPKSPVRPTNKQSSLSHSQSISVADRLWRVQISGTAYPVAFMRYLPALLTLLAGISITAFVVSQVRTSQRKTREAEINQDRNRKLEIACDEADYQKALHEVGEAKLAAANRQITEKMVALETVSDNLSRYVSPQLRELVFKGDQGTRRTCERKLLSVLFADLVGFSDLADELAPNDLIEFLNAYLTEMSTIANAHGGTVDKFIGDGVLVVFGDHDTQGVQQDAAECIATALEMSERMTEMARKRKTVRVKCPVHGHFGISTGRCTVGNVGSRDRFDYTVIGSPVNLAARLEKAAGPDTILICKTTYSYVSDKFVCKGVKNLSLRGIPNPVQAWKVVEKRFDVESHSTF